MNNLDSLVGYKYFRNIFYLYMSIVLLTIIGSMYFLRRGSVSAGLLAGGIIIFVGSLLQTARYWQSWNKFFKLAILGLILGVLIFVAYKKIEKIINKNN